MKRKNVALTIAEIKLIIEILEIRIESLEEIDEEMLQQNDIFYSSIGTLITSLEIEKSKSLLGKLKRSL